MSYGKQLNRMEKALPQAWLPGAIASEESPVDEGVGEARAKEEAGAVMHDSAY